MNNESSRQDLKSAETSEPAHKSGHSGLDRAPGPWTAVIDKNDEREFYVTDAEDSVVAYLSGVYEGQMDVARLIAAAPELLEALDELVCFLEPIERDGCLGIPGLATLNRYRLAISRARGESSALKRPSCECCGGSGIGPPNSNFAGQPCRLCGGQ
jgi:hypothetical protein